MTVHRIPALYMRGGTSKGVFFRAADLPPPGAERDRLLLRVIGSPDRYGKHTDGMGGATSSTSKVVVLAASQRPGFDVDYLFGQVAIDRPVVDWSGNCGNLSAAVGPAAMHLGLMPVPADGTATVRIWQANIGKPIVAFVPAHGGQVAEEGDFELDGVTFPAAEIALEFIDPAGEDGDDAGGVMFPTGARIETFEVPGIGAIEATLITAGLPTIYVDAATLGLTGTELQPQVNGDRALLARVEAIRAHGAVRFGLAASAEEATATRPHTPKLAFVAPPARCTASDGRVIETDSIDLLARVFSMGALHHAMTGTGAISLAAASAIPGNLVSRIAQPGADGRIRVGHPSGRLIVGAEASERDGQWTVTKALMSRSARRLMEGWVHVPL
jgi:probable AcnD-accessory protein PrpF